jgi:hypothetical protein
MSEDPSKAQDLYAQGLKEYANFGTSSEFEAAVYDWLEVYSKHTMADDLSKLNSYGDFSGNLD